MENSTLWLLRIISVSRRQVSKALAQCSVIPASRPHPLCFPGPSSTELWRTLTTFQNPYETLCLKLHTPHAPWLLNSVVVSFWKCAHQLLISTGLVQNLFSAIAYWTPLSRPCLLCCLESSDLVKEFRIYPVPLGSVHFTTINQSFQVKALKYDI